METSGRPTPWQRSCPLCGQSFPDAEVEEVVYRDVYDGPSAFRMPCGHLLARFAANDPITRKLVEQGILFDA